MSAPLNNPFGETLSSLLRLRTKAAHHRLDHHPMLAPLVQATLNQAHYVRLIRTLYWIHLPLHAALQDGLHIFFPQSSYQPSERIRWLETDLTNMKVPERRLESVLGHLEFHFDSAAALVGALYTVEGSTMGGQVIARQLIDSLGIDARSGALFFYGHGELTRKRWSDFWQFAGQSSIENAVDAACESAIQVFMGIDQALSKAEAYWTSLDHMQRQTKIVPRVSKVYFDQEH